MLLITLDARGNATIGAAKRTFADVASPLQGVGRVVSRPIENAWRGVTSYGDLERENDRLREELAQQSGDMIAAQVALRDYQELLAQNQLASLSQYTKVTAQVLSYSPNNFRQTVEINQGSSRGIRIGMPVVNAAGLVGKVTSVTPDSAIVLLITDPSYSVTVKIVGEQAIPGTQQAVAENPGLTAPPTSVLTEPTPTSSIDSLVDEPSTTERSTESTIALGELPDETLVPDPASSSTTIPPTTTTIDLTNLSPRELGGLEGRGPDQPPVVRFLNNDRFAREIEVGDLVATSGGTTGLSSLASLAPADLVIGRVARKTNRPGSSGPLVEVEPAADLAHLNFLRVVLYLPPSEVPSTGD
jgi:rod shape-determining protein MreC